MAYPTDPIYKFVKDSISGDISCIKKQTGDYPQLSAQDYSTVKKDKKGNYITKL